VNLIPRFWDVSKGRILLDGRDIRDLTLASLRRQVAQVTQETILFNDTVENNIAYGQPETKTALVEEAARHRGMVYIRTTRRDTPVLYGNGEAFPIGGSKVLRSSENDVITVVAAGITLHEALAAYEELKKAGIAIRIIDLYSIKPMDRETLKQAAHETTAFITVEDHFAEGGIGEAVRSEMADIDVPVYSLAVRKLPKSGKPDELLEYEDISRSAIIKTVRTVARGE